MRGGLVLGDEEAGAFERDVYAHVLPRKLRWVALGVDLDLAIAEADRVALDRDPAGKAAMHRVVAQQMCVGLDRAEIVERDHFDVLAAGLGDGAQDVAADAAKPVDGDPDGHCLTSKISFVIARVAGDPANTGDT